MLTLDAEQPFEKQDLQIADLVEQEGRALVIAVNKWDLVGDRDGHAEADAREAASPLAQVAGVPVVPLSALTGRGSKAAGWPCFDIDACGTAASAPPTQPLAAEA